MVPTATATLTNQFHQNCSSGDIAAILDHYFPDLPVRVRLDPSARTDCPTGLGGNGAVIDRPRPHLIRPHISAP
jgi:hypothetical protein